MNSIILIQLISLLSFIFPLLIILLPWISIDNFFVLFFWFLLISYLELIFKKKGKKYFYLNFLLLLPAIKYPSIGNVVFLSIAAYYTYYYIFQYSSGMRMGFFRKDFQNKLKIILVALIISQITGKLTSSGKDIIPFILIYFISTIILLRNIRHLEHSPDVDRMKRSNAIFAISISILYLLLGMESLKAFIYRWIKAIYIWITDQIFKILYWPIVYMSYYVEKLIRYIMSLMANNQLASSPEGVNGELDFAEWVQNEPTFPLWLSRLLTIAVIIALGLFLAYISYYLFKKKVVNKRKEGLSYREEREFIGIREDKKRKERILFKPKGIREQIRYYYRKLLIKMEKRGVNITSSDTSFEINLKAEKNMDGKALDDLRRIYIEARYKEGEIDESKVKKMKKLYKRLNRN
ncbi:MAG: hypothetical protein GXY96_01560 [Tissierellia bacterium]|nr:hypothetical protein [Tissierellia bacterium]